MDIETCHELSRELEQRLNLKTFPIAIRMLAAGEEPPEGFIRPKRDLGQRMSLCQGFQMTRRSGTRLAMLREDMWCPEPVIGFGLQQAPVFFMEGKNRYPRDVATEEAGRVYAEELPKLPIGKYSGILSAPLGSTPFEPEVIVIYCVPAQLSQLLLAREYTDGHNLPCVLSSHAACIYGVVPALVSRRSQVAIPCRGDRRSAMAEDDEMILTVTAEELQDIITGLRHLETTGSVYPAGYRMLLEYPLPDAYKHMQDMMGFAK